MALTGATDAPREESGGLRVLAVDDEVPALEELVWLLRRDPRVRDVHAAADSATALHLLRGNELDAVFLDIRMPGMTGLELARLLNRQPRPPRVVFITAYDDWAVDAFELQAVDYVLKPVGRDRLAEAVRGVGDVIAAARRGAADDDETVAVGLAGSTQVVARGFVGGGVGQEEDWRAPSC